MIFMDDMIFIYDVTEVVLHDDLVPEFEPGVCVGGVGVLGEGMTRLLVFTLLYLLAPP